MILLDKKKHKIKHIETQHSKFLYSLADRYCTFMNRKNTLLPLQRHVEPVSLSEMNKLEWNIVKDRGQEH